MASSKSVRRRTNKLTKNLNLELFIMSKQEVHLFTNKEADFVSTTKMFLSGSNRFVYMFDNFREEVLQTLVSYLLPRGISQPSWWPKTSFKWWAQLGFPTHKGEPTFESDASKLPKVWKIAVLVGIIEDHSPKVICHALRLDERMKTMMSEKEKFILSAALTILHDKYFSNSNVDSDLYTVTHHREYAVLALPAPQRRQQTNTNTRSMESRKRKKVMRPKKEKAPTISAGTTSNPIFSQAPPGDVNRPDEIVDSGKSLPELLNKTKELDIASSKSVKRRTNKLTKDLNLEFFILSKKEVHLFTNKEADFVSTTKMFLSESNRFVYMFDNFREEALQTLVSYLLPRGISQPSWWPKTSSKWWTQLGFSTFKGEPPFELDASKLPKVWKIAVLVGIIEDHSPKVICHALQLDERMKAMMSEKEKFILSAALTILHDKYFSNSNVDSDPFIVTHCREYVVLALPAPQRQKQTNTNARSMESRKRKKAMRPKKEKAFTISAGTTSNPTSSQVIEVPAKTTLTPSNATENKKEEHSTLVSQDGGKAKEFSNLNSGKSISESAKEKEKPSKDKMEGTDNASEGESRMLEDVGENRNSTAPGNGIPPLSVDDYQVDELPISHEVLQPDDEFLNNIINCYHIPKW